MSKASRRYYWLALAALLALSAYPVVMGLKLVVLQWSGGARPEDYARYVIPYTALCLAVLASAALYPLLSRLKRLSVLAATVLALGLFVGIELFMESITIGRALPQGGAASAVPAVDWQLFTCVSTDLATRVYGNGQGATMVEKVLQGSYSDAYKIHYFLVSSVIITLVVGVFYGYGRQVAGKKPGGAAGLRLQLISAVLLVGLCVLANFTGFFRGTADTLPPLSSALTALFFVVLGAAAGLAAGGWLIGRGRALGVLLPALAAAAVCAAMYYGEYRLLGGSLYRFGASWFFAGLPAVALAPADMLVILLSGLVTAGIMEAAKRRRATVTRGSQAVNKA